MNLNDIKENLFGVPVWSCKFHREELHIHSYLEFLYNLREKEPDRKTRSGQLNYQTNDNLQEEGIFQEFLPLVNGLANDIVDQFKERFDYRVCIKSMWANINGKNASNLPHIHSGDLSGVFYLKVPYNSGDIVFINPAQRSESHRIRIQNRQISVDPTVCLIFPSWLEHYVTPNQTDEDRVSISFNIGPIER